MDFRAASAGAGGSASSSEVHTPYISGHGVPHFARHLRRISGSRTRQRLTRACKNEVRQRNETDNIRLPKILPNCVFFWTRQSLKTLLVVCDTSSPKPDTSTARTALDQATRACMTGVLNAPFGPSGLPVGSAAAGKRAVQPKPYHQLAHLTTELDTGSHARPAAVFT